MPKAVRKRHFPCRVLMAASGSDKWHRISELHFSGAIFSLAHEPVISMFGAHPISVVTAQVSEWTGTVEGPTVVPVVFRYRLRALIALKFGDYSYHYNARRQPRN